MTQERPAARIVCAATLFANGLTVASAHPNDALVTAVVERFKAAGYDLYADGPAQLGFIDQYRTFYTEDEGMNGTYDLPEPRIVCAASRLPDGQVIGSVRHSDALFVGFVERIAKAEGRHPLENAVDEQGFIDQHGAFYTREDAWVIAEAQGQIAYAGNWGTGVLYSENLY